MIQVSYVLRDLQDLEKAIAYFKQFYFPYKDNGFFLINSSDNTPAWLEAIVQGLSAAFPTAAMAGMTNACAIQGGQMQEKATAITLQILQKSQVQVLSYDLSTRSLEEVSEACLADIRALPRVCGIEILYAQKKEATGMPQDLQPFLDVLGQLDVSIPVWGGYADNPAYGGVYGGDNYVYTKKKLYSAGLMIAVYCGDIKIELQTAMGWQPLGQVMTVTAMDGPMIIKEIDHKPAIFFYEKYLQYTNFKNKTLPFPLVHKKYNGVHAHMPLDSREDGALCFNTVSYVGDQLHLAYGDPGTLLRDSKRFLRNILHFSPEGIHILNCNTRRLFLKKASNSIIKDYEQLAPASGGYVDGEIFRRNRKIVGANMMLVVASFREGNVRTNLEPLSIDMNSELELDDSLSTIQHLASFIKVAMTELEDAMNQLSFAASHDNFTGLLNRGSIESLLRQYMKESIEYDRPFSAIMVDVDSFKKVNDNCGHDIGDRVLIQIADTIRDHLRPSDFAGRWGGDEFVILLPGQPLTVAQGIAERLRSHIHITGLMPDNTPITASFGVTTSLPGEEEQAFYKRMDNALYMAKKAGKNQVILLNPHNQVHTLVGHH